MKTIHHSIRKLLLPALCVAQISIAIAAPHAVHDLLDEPDSFKGKEIQLQGVVERVSASRRMVMLIDKEELTCTSGCEPRKLTVQLPPEGEIPSKGHLIQVTGTISKEAPSLQFQAKEFSKTE